MTISYYGNRDIPDPDQPTSQERDHRRDLARAIKQCMQGQTNNTLKLTLNPNVGSTTIIDARISIQTVTVFSPATANAAAEIGNGTLWATPTKGQVVINHANSSQTDRIFQVALVG